MTGTTAIAGATVNCECVSLREVRLGPKVVESVYNLIVAGIPVTNDNFTEEPCGARRTI